MHIPLLICVRVRVRVCVCVCFYIYIYIEREGGGGIHSTQGGRATTRHGVARKTRR